MAYDLESVMEVNLGSLNGPNLNIFLIKVLIFFIFLDK